MAIVNSARRQMNARDLKTCVAGTWKSLTGRALVLLLITLTSPGCHRGAPYEGKTVTELRLMLHDPKPAVQVQGAFGLSRIGKEAADAIPDLIEGLTKEPLLRQTAALALGNIGAEAKSAVPALTTALKDPAWTVRRQAAIALGQIGPDAGPALPSLEKLARDKDRQVARAAIEAVSRIKK
jgi:HEAT repeat protein